ncbi:MAG: hypothetical protein GY754_15870 [bacterium]|nr:hypothetical protein [bacterium]
MKKNLILLVILCLSVFASCENELGYYDEDFNQLAKSVSPTEDASYGLAQKCLAIQSPATGKFLKNEASINGNAGIYGFNATSVNDAAQFFMKPTAFGKYLLTDKNGKYLSSLFPLTATNTQNPGLHSEWDITANKYAANKFYFKLRNRYTKTPMKNDYWVKAAHSVGCNTIYVWELRTEEQFKLVEQNNCRPYPEVAVNVSGNSDALKGNVNEPVRGIIDAHTHITSYEFMGGKVIHGAPFHPYGVPYALSNSIESHGINGSLDLIGNIYAFGNLSHTYDTRGWPDFPWWPNHYQLTHQGHYYKWIERAWLSGVRMITTYLVENKVLCKAQRTINPLGWAGNDCNEMNSVRLQVNRLREMQDYIDAQFGGPGKGFFRIVTSPEQARQVIADGKLAVIMGIEVSEIFNSAETDAPLTYDKIDEGINELANLGIRAFYISHKFDNQLAGAILEEGFINIGEALSAGHWYETKECNADTAGKPMTADIPILDDIVNGIPGLSDIMSEAGLYPSYDYSYTNHCNIRGLSPLGVYMVNRLIDKKLMFELDHLSDDSITQVVDIAESRNYSGVISSHSFMHRDRMGNLHKNFIRMIELGGFASPYNGNADGIRTVEEYLDVIETTPFLQGVGIGTDMGGLGGQPGPRSDATANPLAYPFSNEFGLTFNRQVSGNRTFDLNKDGVAHYGLVADQVQDDRIHAGERVYEGLMNSAEAYLQMWQRARANSSTIYVNPL